MWVLSSLLNLSKNEFTLVHGQIEKFPPDNGILISFVKIMVNFLTYIHVNLLNFETIFFHFVDDIKNLIKLALSHIT
jgi:hypothetical protein